MWKDRFDLILIVSLALVLLISAAMLLNHSETRSVSHASSINRQMEQEMLFQARLSFLDRHYNPVIQLRESGSYPEALMKLEELNRTLPEEAHNDLLMGDIFLRMGLYDQALTKLADAVRKNADYVDLMSPLSHRPLVESAVASALPVVRDRLRAQPENLSLEKVVKDGYYLQSRLAGGCE
jgi:predicted Zn-dependent protease